MEDLYAVSKGVPKLHVYIREAEPCDEFDAGGMHMATPLKMKRPIPVHKSEADRAEAAKDCKIYLESFAGKDSVTMWMDGCGTRTPRPGALAPSQRVRLLAPSLSSSLAHSPWPSARSMDDALEATYEARPWRWYVIEAATGKIVTSTGLAPFNMIGKKAKIQAACA